MILHLTLLETLIPVMMYNFDRNITELSIQIFQLQFARAHIRFAIQEWSCKCLFPTKIFMEYLPRKFDCFPVTW